MSGISPACHTITADTPRTTMRLSRSGIRMEGRRRGTSSVAYAAWTRGGGNTISGFTLDATGSSGRLTAVVGIAADVPAVRVVQPRDSAHAISSAPTKFEQLG